jgi:hypothetical protein
MASYLALITLRGDIDPDDAPAIADALGATAHEPVPGGLLLHVPGEAPDLRTATAEAHRHAAEVLDGWTVDVEVQASDDA